MTEKTAPSFNVDIHMAGDIHAAGLLIQRYALDCGMCVTLTPQSFIYTGGREEGFKVGFINYPRFPKEPGDIVARAHDLARVLRVQLGQQSYSIVTPTETTWVSHRPEDTNAELLEAAKRLLALDHGDEGCAFPTKQDIAVARAAVAKAEVSPPAPVERKNA